MTGYHKPCPRCGAALPAEASFCPHCAETLRPRKPASPPAVFPRRRFLWGGAALMLLAAAAALIFDIPAGALPDGTVAANTAKTQILSRVILAASYLSLLLIACSRERVEDEMVAAMRLRALATVAYAAFALFTVITIVSTLTGADTYNGLALFLSSPTLLFWAYEALFRISIARNRKHSSL